MRINLILASLDDYNPGMIAVNNAAASLLSDADIELQTFEFLSGYSAPDATEAKEYFGRISHVHSADRIVFWGDWLHMHFYHAELMRAAGSGRCGREPVSLSDIQRHLFLEDMPKSRLRDVAILGTTLALDSPLTRAELPYRAKLRTLYGNAGLVLLRDTFSAGIVQGWRSTTDRCTGLDGAFFYRPRVELETSPNSGRLGFFFGRSSRLQRILGQSLVASIGRASGLEPQWIPWYSKTREGAESTHVSTAILIDLARGVAKKWSPSSQQASGRGQILLDGLIDRIRRCSWVVTDTYHLAVVAWAQAVPCTLVGSGFGSGAGDVNAGPDGAGIDKRAALYLTLDSAPLYCTFEDLSSRKGLKLAAERQVAHMRAKESFPASVLEGIEDRRGAFRRDLATWLQS